MKKPLVSISVITYNSSKYVLDTLESVKMQTYSPLELVVSDDSSTDDTVAICRDWIEKNKERFVSAKVVVAPKNQGISANYNLGMDNCSGDYIKEIAWDDMLLPNCVADYVNFVTEHPKAYFCFGKAQVFDGDEERRRQAREIWFNYDFFTLSNKEQLKWLFESSNPICSATYFYNRRKAIEYGIRNDEEVPFVEDWPKWILILRKGQKMYFIDKEVAAYRLSATSLSSQHKSTAFWNKQKAVFQLKYIIPYRKKRNKIKGWRMEQYAKQNIKRRWWRGLVLWLYESGASLYRILARKK